MYIVEHVVFDLVNYTIESHRDKSIIRQKNFNVLSNLFYICMCECVS